MSRHIVFKMVGYNSIKTKILGSRTPLKVLKVDIKSRNLDLLKNYFSQLKEEQYKYADGWKKIYIELIKKKFNYLGDVWESNFLDITDPLHRHKIIVMWDKSSQEFNLDIYDGDYYTVDDAEPVRSKNYNRNEVEKLVNDLINSLIINKMPLDPRDQDD